LVIGAFRVVFVSERDREVIEQAVIQLLVAILIAALSGQLGGPCVM
jgi:hypothetical protein